MTKLICLMMLICSVGFTENVFLDPFDTYTKLMISEKSAVFYDLESEKLILYYNSHFWDITNKIHFDECPCLFIPG